jgi:nucleotide-binding universal stress UspA family protein
MSVSGFILLVPTDFTKVADAALNHAINLAVKLNGEISLLHIVSKESNLEPAIAKLTYISEKVGAEHAVKTTYIARVGNIFDDIGDVAAEIGAKLIVMGTHGMTGFQKITGSHALKVITNSTVPFIVVQENVQIKEYRKIVFPLDLSRDSKQKLHTTMLLAEKFNSKIYIVTNKEASPTMLLSLEKNLDYAKKYLEDQNIAFEVNALAGDKFVQNTLEFAVQIDADLIAIVNSSEGNIVGSADAQQIISNESKIPVLCVNSSVSYSSGMMFM